MKYLGVELEREKNNVSCSPFMPRDSEGVI
jgi:hypothetical protein